MSRLLLKHSLLDAYKRRMPALSVDLKNQIELINSSINHQIDYWKNPEIHQKILDKVQNLDHAYKDLNRALDELSSHIEIYLRKKEKSIIQIDYQRNINWDEEDFILRNSYLTKECKELYLELIQKIGTGWQHGSLEINPGDGFFSTAMNAADPQYAIVFNEDVERAIKSKFNEFYAKRRLRCYRDISEIPDNSIGYATCINLYEYLPLDHIKHFSTQAYNKLKPGGHFLITYNDCNQRTSLELLANNYRCLATKEIIEGLHYSIGFDTVISAETNNGVWSHMVLKKPGQLSSQKMNAPAIKFVKHETI